jgi:hypothetical protein
MTSVQEHIISRHNPNPKRFVRDFVHYNDNVFCAAGKIVQLLQDGGKERGFDVDEEGAGSFSALHVRRGDVQCKEVVISAEEWYNNTGKLWGPKELFYCHGRKR